MAVLPEAGLVLVDKPEGWSSHDVVAFLRPILGTRRVGHGGTLDPLASGLLVVMYGHATKLSDLVHATRKTYVADVVLGCETTTDDREGAVSARADVPALSDESVRGTLASFLGRQTQVPPAFSALHVDGRRAYAVSRRGEIPALAPRPVEFYELRLLEMDAARLRVRVECSAGTYVRALARDLGRALGTRAHLGGLRRLTIGPFSVEGALTPERIRTIDRPELAERVISEHAARGLLAGERAHHGASASPTPNEGK